MARIGVVGILLFTLYLINEVIAETSLQPVSNKAANLAEDRQAIVGTGGWWPWGGWGWGWGWGVAVFVLAIVKGSILLGLFVIWAFFRTVGGGHGKHGCAPIIIRESPPPFFEHHHEHHPWDRVASANEYPRVKRSTDYADSPPFWTDIATDISFSFLGIHSRDCRKRFVCEVDVRARNEPMLSLAMNMFGVDIFRRYRSVADKVANSFEECSRLYNKCKFNGPSIMFNLVTTGNPETLQDYDESVQEQLSETSNSVESYDENSIVQEEVTTEEGTTQAPVTTTTSADVAQKRFAYKRKRFFKLWKK
ncbi:uncharacterized protein LOC128736727 [Sabethes cyaneus]|uniref:uncharacterized protein LOC128736727 n=1 Tax=Sabethes cyaneus TaxID=53552 RepID=UPI00237D9A83|nr:uncharacterized protein LOC128736727 [Sabethes cyaneus]